MNELTIRNQQIKEKIRSLLAELPAEDQQEIVAETLNTTQGQFKERLADLAYQDFGLSDLEYSFVLEYLTNGYNATQAYKAIKPHVQIQSARVHGCVMKAKPHVQRFLGEMMDRIGLTNSELERRLESIVNTSMEDFFSLNPFGELELDLKKAYASGAFANVQMIRWTKGAKWPTIQFVDRTRGLDILTRVRGMQKEVRINADLAKLAQASNLSPEQLEQLKDAMKEEMVIDLKARQVGDKVVYEAD